MPSSPCLTSAYACGVSFASNSCTLAATCWFSFLHLQLSLISVLVTMRRGIHETRNKWDEEYVRRGIHETREMHADETRAEGQGWDAFPPLMVFSMQAQHECTSNISMVISRLERFDPETYTGMIFCVRPVSPSTDYEPCGWLYSQTGPVSMPIFLIFRGSSISSSSLAPFCSASTSSFLQSRF